MHLVLKRIDTIMEQLITSSEDSPTDKSIVPVNDGTISFIKYDVLKSNPYKYNAQEFFYEVHCERRNKRNLKIENYSLQRMQLLKKLGWGLHIDKNKKIALIPCESTQYMKMLKNNKIKKIKAYRNKKKV
jgi:hypothetical protein